MVVGDTEQGARFQGGKGEEAANFDNSQVIHDLGRGKPSGALQAEPPWLWKGEQAQTWRQWLQTAGSSWGTGQPAESMRVFSRLEY